MRRVLRLPGLLLLRTLVHELRGLRAAQQQQNVLLARLVDHVAPIAPETDPEIVRTETGLSYADTTEQALILDYVMRTTRDTGHVPTDDEILIYLADEKTTDLHKRLIDRDQEIDRLSRSGRG